MVGLVEAILTSRVAQQGQELEQTEPISPQNHPAVIPWERRADRLVGGRQVRELAVRASIPRSTIQGILVVVLPVERRVAAEVAGALG